MWRRRSRSRLSSKTTREAGCIWYVNGVAARFDADDDLRIRPSGTFIPCAAKCTTTEAIVAKVYKVKVNGIPLEVEFSDSGDEVSCDQGDEVRISATVVGGDKEVKHSWSIDGTVVSETADFIHTFMEPGTFTLARGSQRLSDDCREELDGPGGRGRTAADDRILSVPGAIDSHRGDGW